ncbi:MAG: RNA-guided pseudouridylation complex pseudouridine synthase subunit Cbf5 [Thermoplasmata archaeon]
MKYVKENVSNVSKWGEYPHKRSIEDLIPRSIVILDKPSGPTSHQVSSWIQKMFNEKAGHSGTLDPNVTGVLPMGIGYSVRLMDLLHTVPKEYVAAVRFHGNVSVRDVKEVFKEYIGEIYQMPPVRSGVKRERRVREIYELDLLDYFGQEFLFRVKCESGTYIRTLCKDLGKSLGVGGHMMELRRTISGGFKEEQCHILQDLRDALEFYKDGDPKSLKEILLPYERAFDIFPKIRVKDTAAGALLNGADLAVPGIMEMDEFEQGEIVGLISQKGEGLAVGEAVFRAEKIMEMDEGLVVDTDRVFHPSGEYPRGWK